MRSRKTSMSSRSDSGSREPPAWFCSSANLLTSVTSARRRFSIYLTCDPISYDDVFKLAERHSLNVYDAAYLDVAIREKIAACQSGRGYAQGCSESRDPLVRDPTIEPLLKALAI